MADNKFVGAFGRLKAGITKGDLVLNLVCPMLLLVVNAAHLFYGCLSWATPLDWCSILSVDLYLFALLLLAALKLPKYLPERQVALVTVPALLLVLVMAFGELYISNQHVGRSRDGAIVVDPIKEPWDAAYFSLVTITTLGYGDYAPQEQDARKLVIGELLSGALLLFFAFPVLGSRLALFDEPTGTTIRRLADGAWEVKENNAPPVRYSQGKRLTIVIEEQGVTQANVSN